MSTTETAALARQSSELSDGDVVRRVIHGEVELFEVLMRRHNQRVYRVGRAVLADDALAEDLAQEAWVRVFEHLVQFEERSLFSTWLTKIVLHEAWARSRKARRLQPIPDEIPNTSEEWMSSEPDPEARMLGNETRDHLEAAIESLPESYRVVLVLRDVEDLSTSETADLLGLTEGTVKVRLHRARAKVRKTLASRVGPAFREAFPFLGARCDRLVRAVMARVGLPRPA
jgi:RNA polymerase sigma-70 factor (ECF subfamily)